MEKERNNEIVSSKYGGILKDNLGSYIGVAGILKKDDYFDLSRVTKPYSSSSVRFCCGIPGGGHSVRAHSLLYDSLIERRRSNE